MPCFSHGENAIEHIHSERDALFQLRKLSNSHKVPWCVFWEQWSNLFHYSVHFFRTFADSQSSNCVSIEPDCNELLCAFFPKIKVEAALDDAKKKRTFRAFGAGCFEKRGPLGLLPRLAQI